MNIPLLARTLACGVEAAALISFEQAEQMLASKESLSDVVNRDNDFATYEILAIQRLKEPAGPFVELRVLASDGMGQMSAYLYVGVTGAASAAT
jgi:hypothetical protein